MTSVAEGVLALLLRLAGVALLLRAIHLAERRPRDVHRSPSGGRLPTEREVGDLAATFDGALRRVAQARPTAEGLPSAMARASPPMSPESWHEFVLLVVDEPASNTVRYAPGPFTLRMCPVFDDTHALCTRVSVIVHAGGKDVHAFLPCWGDRRFTGRSRRNQQLVLVPPQSEHQAHQGRRYEQGYDDHMNSLRRTFRSACPLCPRKTPSGSPVRAPHTARSRGSPR